MKRLWPFNRKAKREAAVVCDHDAAKEVAAHKQATKREVEKVKKASEKLGKAFEANGFTLKIYLAAGGKHPASQGK